MRIDDSQPHPFLVGLLSLFLPGTGHLWITPRDVLPLRALVVFVVWATVWVLHLSPWWVVVHVAAALDAGLLASRGRRGSS